MRVIQSRIAWAALLGSAVAASAQGQGPVDELLQELTAGNRAFVRGEPLERPIDEGLRRDLEHGVRPRAIVVTASDSRLAPEVVFQTAFGDLYVIRVAGGVCDPATLASIEFAAVRYGIGLCVVLGHDRCDVVGRPTESLRATAAGERLHEHLAPALRIAKREHLKGDELIIAAVEENVHTTIGEAMRRSPTLQQLIEAGAFRFAPALYQSASGNVRWLHNRPASKPVAPEAHRTKRVRGLPPQIAMRMLHSGHLRFLNHSSSSADISPERRGALIEGQRPNAVIVADADPRLVPERVFDAGLGELFVIRVAGLQLDQEVVASIEHAVDFTGASLVVVLGQDRSDAVQYAIEHRVAPRSEHIERMFEWLAPSIESARREGLAGSQLSRRASEINVERFLSQLRKRSKTLQKIESHGLVAMVPALYEVGSGDLFWMKEDSGQVAARPAGESVGHLVDDGSGQGQGQGHGQGHGQGRGHDDGGHADHGVHGSDDHAAPGHDDGEHAGGGHGDAHGAPHASDTLHPSGGHGEHAAPNDHGFVDHPLDDAHGHSHDAGGHHASPDTHAKAVDSEVAALAEQNSVLPILLAGMCVAIAGISILLFSSNKKLKRRLSLSTQAGF